MANNKVSSTLGIELDMGRFDRNFACRRKIRDRSCGVRCFYHNT